MSLILERIRNWIPPLLGVLSLWSAWAALASADPVGEVVALYDQGLFQEAELLALRTLQSSDSLAPVDRGILHRTLGFTYVALGENEKAQNQFIAWLDFDPLAELDSVYISPKIITVFREAQADYLNRQTQQQKAQIQPPDLRLLAATRSMIFPGWGQVYAGYRTKGFALMTSEALLLGAIVFCQVQYEDSRDKYLAERSPDRMQDLYDDANNFYRARNASIALAAGVYLFSLYDALHLLPQQRVEATLTFSCQPDPEKFLSLTLHF
ncbi:MAG TPA: DUF5683 domain-containing protein [bacterium]